MSEILSDQQLCEIEFENAGNSDMEELIASHRALHSQAQEWERKYHNAIAGYETFMADANRDRDTLEAVCMEQRGMIEKLHSQVRELEADRNKWKRICEGNIQDICDFEKEMEEKHGMEFSDDYGGVWHGDAVTKKINELQARITALENELKEKDKHESR